MTPERFEQQSKEYLLLLMGPEYAGQLVACANKIIDLEERLEFYARTIRDVEHVLNGDKPVSVSNKLKYKWEPVSVREFMYSPKYLGKEQEIYPKVLAELEEMNSGKYDEIVLTGGIGSGKTSCALYSQAYQVYLLSCLTDPHRLFGLDRSSEIKLVFQSINAKLAKGVDYNRFRALLSATPYFCEHFPFAQDVESIIKFPNRIEIEPIAGVETGAIGQNVIGGIIDEVNFMAVTDNSKMSAEGGTYDQATALYDSIARRRRSRFNVAGGGMPGLLCLVSSKKVPGQFTDKKEEEAKTNPRIYVYDKRVWDVKPDESFSKERFYVFVGDEHRKPRLLLEGETPDKSELLDEKGNSLIDAIPMDFFHDFQSDIIKALRDIAGRSSLALHPFMPNREGVLQNFGKRQNLFDLDDTDFVTSQVGVRNHLLRVNRQRLRWVHIDLGLTSDSAGLVIGHCPEFVEIKRGDHHEILPRVEIDAVLEIKPPKNGEIDFASIRRILYKLRDMGLPLWWVTLDSFQSADTMQILRQKGFTVGYQSVDIQMTPYELTKQALYDGRVTAPNHPKLQKELLQLERNFKTNKVDHHAHGSKDLSDALAGVVYGLTTRREVWGDHRVSFAQAVSISSLIRDKEEAEKTN